MTLGHHDQAGQPGLGRLERGDPGEPPGTGAGTGRRLSSRVWMWNTTGRRPSTPAQDPGQAAHPVVHGDDRPRTGARTASRQSCLRTGSPGRGCGRRTHVEHDQSRRSGPAAARPAAVRGTRAWPRRRRRQPVQGDVADPLRVSAAGPAPAVAEHLDRGAEIAAARPSSARRTGRARRRRPAAPRCRRRRPAAEPPGRRSVAHRRYACRANSRSSAGVDAARLVRIGDRHHRHRPAGNPRQVRQERQEVDLAGGGAGAGVGQVARPRSTAARPC